MCYFGIIILTECDAFLFSTQKTCQKLRRCKIEKFTILRVQTLGLPKNGRGAKLRPGGFFHGTPLIPNMATRGIGRPSVRSSENHFFEKHYRTMEF